MSEKRINVCYVGDDKGYWSKIKKAFREIFSHQRFEFINLDLHRGFDPNETFYNLVKLDIDIIFIDFSIGIESCLKLCKHIRRDSVTKRLSTTALHTLNEFKSTIPLALMIGTRLNHIKSTETHDVAFDAMSLHDVENIHTPEFATADAEMEAHITQDLRISWIDQIRFHIETNSPLVNGERIHLEGHFLEHIMPDKNMLVTNFSDTNMYFDHRYSYDLEFEYLEEYSDDRYAGISDEELRFKVKKVEKKKRLKDIEGIRSEINNWIRERRKTSVDPKKVKFLLIDRSLSLLVDKNIDLEKLPYILNIQSQLVGQLETIQRFLPNVIAFNYETPEDPEEEDSLNINGLMSLRNLMGAIKFLKGYEPIILVFNFPGTKSLVTTNAAYPKLLVHQNPFSFDVIDQLARRKIKVLEKEEEIEIEKSKLLEESLHGFEHQHIEVSDKVYFSSRDPETLIKMVRPIKIVRINECYLYFSSEQHIPYYTVFEIEDPIEALITIVPITSTDHFYQRSNIYKALINGVDDLEKKNIRQVVNNLIYIMNNPDAFEESPQRIREKRDAEYKRLQELKGDELHRERAKQAAIAKRKIEEAEYEAEKLRQLEEKEARHKDKLNPYKKPEA